MDERCRRGNRGRNRCVFLLRLLLYRRGRGGSRASCLRGRRRRRNTLYRLIAEPSSPSRILAAGLVPNRLSLVYRSMRYSYRIYSLLMTVVAALLFVPHMDVVERPVEVLSAAAVTTFSTHAIAPAFSGRPVWNSDRVVQRPLSALVVRSSLLVRRPFASYALAPAPASLATAGDVRVPCGRSPPRLTSHV